MSGIGWFCQVNTDDSRMGFNDPGQAHFLSDRYGSVAREVIQNSLDACSNRDLPVRVSFKAVKIPTNDIPGIDELREINQKLLAEGRRIKDKDEENDAPMAHFKEAVDTLKRANIDVLQISEENTTGMAGPCEDGSPYHAYMKAGGDSVKVGVTNAGGSHGIGKKAPMVVSNQRALFVSTKWGEPPIHYCQGRGDLMSYSEFDGGKKRTYSGTYYWGIKEGCVPIEGAGKVSEWLRRDEIGTTIFVLGFRKQATWENELIAAVVQSFFVAIWRGHLEIEVEHNTIDKANIREILDRGKYRKAVEHRKGDAEKFDLSREFLYCESASKSESFTEHTEHTMLGHCSVKYRVYEGAPKKVCFIRNGMLITTDLPRLKNWPNVKDFVAIVECHSQKGLAHLRAMEPPQHNSLDPERLQLKDQAKGTKALSSLGADIRDLIKRNAQIETTGAGPIHWLADFFEDDSEGNGAEESFDTDPDGNLLAQMRPVKRTLPALTEEDIDIEDGEEEGEHGGHGDGGGGGGGGTSDGPGEGDGTGGTGPRGGRSGGKVELKDVRVVPAGTGTQLFDVWFTPRVTGPASVKFSVMGADVQSFVKVVKVETPNGEADKGQVKIDLERNKRIQMRVELEREVTGALKLDARAGFLL